MASGGSVIGVKYDGGVLLAARLLERRWPEAGASLEKGEGRKEKSGRRERGKMRKARGRGEKGRKRRERR